MIIKAFWPPTVFGYFPPEADPPLAEVIVIIPDLPKSVKHVIFWNQQTSADPD
jgi:hypothetical protein